MGCLPRAPCSLVPKALRRQQVASTSQGEVRGKGGDGGKSLSCTHRCDGGFELATRVEEPELIHVGPKIALLKLSRVTGHPRMLERSGRCDSLVLRQ